MKRGSSRGAEDCSWRASSTPSSAWNPRALADGETEAEKLRDPPQLAERMHAPQGVPETPAHTSLHVAAPREPDRTCTFRTRRY